MSYRVTARRWAKGWELSISDTKHPEMAVTQSHGLWDADRMVRSWLDITDHPDAETADLIWTYDVGDAAAQSELVAARQAGAEADRLQREVRDRTRQAVRTLRERGLKGSEIATIIGLSKQRISQLLADA